MGQRPCCWYWQNLVYAREGGPMGPKQPGPSQSLAPPSHSTPATPQPQLFGICVNFVFLFKSPNRIMSQVLPIFKGFCDFNRDAHLLRTPWLIAHTMTFFRVITSLEGLGKINSVDASSMLMSLLGTWSCSEFPVTQKSAVYLFNSWYFHPQILAQKVLLF